jgi:hypothetical protein
LDCQASQNGKDSALRPWQSLTNMHISQCKALQQNTLGLSVANQLGCSAQGAVARAAFEKQSSGRLI